MTGSHGGLQPRTALAAQDRLDALEVQEIGSEVRKYTVEQAYPCDSGFGIDALAKFVS